MFEISTRGRYATRIMVFLAEHGIDAVIRRQEIVESQELSVDYVEQLLLRLKEAGFVRSQRGAHGGYALARDPADITVAAVLEVMEGPLNVSHCDRRGCTQAASCPTRPVWDEASAALQAVMTAHTIAELAQQAEGAPHA